MSTVISIELSEVERESLDKLEQVIERGKQTFFAVGHALAEIRKQRLYRASHRDFASYLHDRWGMSRTQGDRLIMAAKVVENLTPIGVIPEHESQARHLAKLEEKEQVAAWKEALETAPESGVTAGHVKGVVRKRIVAKTSGGTTLPPQADGLSAGQTTQPTAPPIQYSDTFDPAEFVPATVQGVDGSTVPEALRQVFEVAPEFDDQRHKLTGIKSWMTQRRKHPAGAKLEEAYARIITDIDNLDRELKFARPYCACPYCKEVPAGETCAVCKGKGWITEAQYARLPSEFKKGAVLVPKRSGGKLPSSTTPSGSIESAERLVAQLERALLAINEAQPDSGRLASAKRSTHSLVVLLDNWRKSGE
jgi:hypothetical protein